MHSAIAGLLLLIGSVTEERPFVLIVVGASGEPKYGDDFRTWASRWRESALKGNARVATIGIEEVGGNDLERLRMELETQEIESEAPLWIVLIGHGTFDGREAKFNLRGPDLSPAQLAEWLSTSTRPVVVINCSSASGSFVNALSGPQRVIVTATKSGDEQNLTRFGEFLSSTIVDPSADLDKDGQVSLLEAFVGAAGRMNESYKAEGLLATEHPLLEDNGDGLGTSADWFRGVRATRTAEGGALADGLRAHQLHLIAGQRDLALGDAARRRRDEIEQLIAVLRAGKDGLPEDVYFERLEPLMLELAEIYRSVE